MTGPCRMKIMEAGLDIYRRDLNSLVITKCTKRGGWTRVHQCTTKRELLRRWERIMSRPNSIAD